ncbi:hypothetical protein LPJ59_002486 [Coemansia sp. RSA 2399]|nr:hypothetical protein LPJ59_002486 [Coemansia sp. RSA 2399]KAJ1902738.1 hypothetical protein LPJ81_003439 [Coemansia sp. IMI 209127]
MHRFYHHHHAHGGCRSIKGKLLLVGVTLWLTSTVIAGIRRSTGRTHNAHPLPPPASLPGSSAEEDTQQLRAKSVESLDATRAAAEAQLSSLESEYIDSARDAYTRDQRLRSVAARRFQFDQHWIALRSALDGHHHPYHHHHHHGGFVRWYLGVGERTFDWMARKLAASHRFHWDDPATAHQELAARPDYHHMPPYYSRGYFDCQAEYPYRFGPDNARQRHHAQESQAQQASDTSASN